MYGTSLFMLLEPVMVAGTMSDKAVDGGGKEDPAYPGESPTDAEFDEWLKRLQGRDRILTITCRSQKGLEENSERGTEDF